MLAWSRVLAGTGLSHLAISGVEPRGEQHSTRLGRECFMQSLLGLPPPVTSLLSGCGRAPPRASSHPQSKCRPQRVSNAKASEKLGLQSPDHAVSKRNDSAGPVLVVGTGGM
ncbi:hypothetical protein IWX49DRAFT_372322 [Phyllosticta citricarpa]|uniref:Uncharacterized protein n=1 Tax=Phyllosticta citricarpa TaxID=55181 RepID=A0ABR1MIU2_9PEZI